MTKAAGEVYGKKITRRGRGDSQHVRRASLVIDVAKAASHWIVVICYGFLCRALQNTATGNRPSRCLNGFESVD